MYGKNRSLLPDDTYVIVGFYKSEAQKEWIIKNGLYNFRTGSGNGSLELSPQMVSAKYLLLHTHKEDSSSELWEISGKGPKVFSKADMMRRKYPSDNPKDYYLVVGIKKVEAVEFEAVSFEFKKLSGYKTNRQSGYPFAVSLSELIKHKVKEED